MVVAIIAPQFTTASAGIFVLHRLGQYISHLGHTVAMVVPGKSQVDLIQLRPVPELVIVPEIYEKPLNCRNVARWCLNAPGKLKNQWGTHGPSRYENELVMYWPTQGQTARAATNGPILEFWLGTIDPEIFHRAETKIYDNCHYIGKGEHFVSKYGNLIPPGSIEITKSIPQTKVAEIMRRSKRFWSFADNTSCSAEAYMCGCDVMLMRSPGVWSPYTPEEIDRTLQFIIDPPSEIARTRKMLEWCEDQLRY